jgi:hypothetical protein
VKNRNYFDLLGSSSVKLYVRAMKNPSGFALIFEESDFGGEKNLCSSL